MPGGPSLPSRYQLVLFSFCLYVLVLTVNISKALLHYCVHTSCLINKLLNAKSMFEYWLNVITLSYCCYVNFFLTYQFQFYAFFQNVFLGKVEIEKRKSETQKDVLVYSVIYIVDIPIVQNYFPNMSVPTQKIQISFTIRNLLCVTILDIGKYEYI